MPLFIQTYHEYYYHKSQKRQEMFMVLVIAGITGILFKTFTGNNNKMMPVLLGMPRYCF